MATKKKKESLSESKIQKYPEMTEYKKKSVAFAASDRALALKEGNRDIMNFTLELMKIGASCNRKSPEDMFDHFTMYLELCSRYGMKVTNKSAYLSMNITHQEATWMRSGQRYKDNPKYQELISRVDMVCSMAREQQMAEGSLNPIAGIWWQKNYDQMRDNTQVVEIKSDPLGDEQVSAEELAEKYKEVL